MPANAEVKDTEILEIMKYMIIFNSDNKMYTEKGSPVWQEATDILNKFDDSNPRTRPRITRKNLYMKFYRNCNGIKDKLMEMQGIKIIQAKRNKKLCDKKQKIDSNEISQHQLEIESDEKTEKNNVVNDLENLHKLKFSVEYFDIIQKICPRSFHLFFFSKRQISLFKGVMEQNIDIFFIPVNALINKFQYPNYQSEIIIFYAFVAQLEEQTVFLAQCLTEKLKMQTFQEFTLQLLKKTNCQPTRIISPYCYEILSAQSLAYNHCHLDQYKESCYNYLLGNLPIEKFSRTIIMVEVMTVFNSAENKLKCVPHVSSLVRKFFVDSIILLSVITTFEDFNKRVKDVFRLMVSPYENDSVFLSYSELQSEKKNNTEYMLLKKRYQSFSLMDTKDFPSPPESVFPNNTSNINHNNQLQEHFNNIYEEILTECNSNQKNMNANSNLWNCQEFASHFLQYLYQFPLWTSMVTSKMASPPISTAVSSNIFKHFDFGRTLRVDQFVEESQNPILDCCSKGEKILLLLKKRNINSRLNPIRDYSFLSYEENWMGKNNYDKDSDDEFLSKQMDETNNCNNKHSDSEEASPQDTDDSFQNSPVPEKSKGFDINNRFEKLATKAVEHPAKRKFGAKRKAVNRIPKHTVPCPAIKIIHEQIQPSQKNKRIEKFIKNGNFLAPRPYNKETYSLADTSLFDAVVEIFSYAFRSLRTFQDVCSSLAKTCQDELCIYKIISHWSLKGCYASFYSTRFSVFLKLGSVDKNNIIKISDPKIFLGNLLQGHSSRSKKFVCNICNTEHIENDTLINLENNQFDVKLLKQKIEQALIAPAHYTCPKCSNETTCFYEFGNHIFMAFESSVKMFLHQFCSKIVLNDDEYHLTGILGHEQQDSSFNIAYIRSLKSDWKAINGMKRRNQQRSLGRIPEVYIYSAVYINLSNHPAC